MEPPQQSLGMAPVGVLLPRVMNSSARCDVADNKPLNGLGFPRFLLLKIPWVVLVTRSGFTSPCSPAGHCSCPGTLQMWRRS